MPTARELLAQADALMRRNRPEPADEFPVLTDAVPVIDDEPTPPPPPTPQPPAGDDADDADAVPILTDQVMTDDVDEETVDVDDGAHDAGDVAVDAGDDASDDPSDEEAPPALAGAPEVQAADIHRAEGEPSAWLEFDDDTPSVIGDVPDSIAVVPPPDRRRPATEALAGSMDVEDIELTSAPGEPVEDDLGEDFDDDLGVPPARSPVAVAAPEPQVLDSVSIEDATATPPEVESSADTTFMAESETTQDADRPAEGLSAPAVADESIEDTSPAQPKARAWTATTGAAVMDVAYGEAPDAQPITPDAQRFAAAPPAPSAPQPPAPPTPEQIALDTAREQARWDAVAEEVRMQVLQRIDLFTDTGLRTQLGARLQPIVDRASADLVATINQHVGELLRAYVAEAIEREIEVWRRDN